MRLGIDLGGSKIEGALLDRSGQIRAQLRVPTPETYADCVGALVKMVRSLEQEAPGACVGVCCPGARDPESGRMTNSFNTPVQGRDLLGDLCGELGQRVRLANDADCFALSEAIDGAAAGARVVAGVILGTGVGAGIVVDGKLLSGIHAMAGEWGHSPLPDGEAFASDAPLCTCGRRGCVEAFVSGRGMTRDHHARHNQRLDAAEICARAQRGDAAAGATLDAWYDRLARALSTLINIVDPYVVVFGGGLSAAPRLCEAVQERLGEHVFAPQLRTELRVHRHGDASGLRGAAWLWPRDAGPLGSAFVAPLGPPPSKP